MNEELDRMALLLAKRLHGLTQEYTLIEKLSMLNDSLTKIDRAHHSLAQVIRARSALRGFALDCGEDFVQQVQRHFVALNQQEVSE